MKEILIGGVKVTVIGEDKIEPGAPVILAVQVHGRTRSRLDCIKFAKYLQHVPNLVCATWDLPNHGERLIDEKANASWSEGNPLHLVEMQSILEQGSTEAVTILRNLPHHFPGLNFSHKVIIGVSLGGYITWKVASEHSDSDPLVPPKYTVDWSKDAAPCQRVEIIPNVEHEVPREMIDLTAEYLASLVSKA